MKKVIFIIALVSISFLHADKYAGEIFKIGAGVKNFALGNIGITDEEGFALAYWNASLLSKQTQTKYELSHAEEFNGLMTFDTFSAIWGKRSKISFVLTRIGVNNIPLTKWDSEANRPYKYDSVNNSDYVIYVGISHKIGEMSFGLTPKLAYRNIAGNHGYGFGADISTFYDFSDKLRFAARLKDVFTTPILWKNGTIERVNPGFDLEFRYKFLLPIIKNEAKFYTQSEIMTEDRDYSAQFSLNIFSFDFHFGLEIAVINQIDLIFGLDGSDISSGLVFSYKNWNLNYCLAHNSDLDNSHRISIGYHL